MGWKINAQKIKAKSVAQTPITLTCEKMLFGGLGLCRTDSGVVFAEGLMPSETAECEYSSKSGGISVYKAKTISAKSPHRREPICQHFGICGGCDWLYMDYQYQISRKIEIFSDLMRRIGKISDLPRPKVFFDSEQNYRIRVKFSVNSQTGELGFLSKKSRKIIAIKECPLLSENLNSFLRTTPPQIRKEKKISVIDSGDKLLLDNSVGEIEVGGYKFEINGNSFFQANKLMTEKMANWVAEQVSNCENLLDIYGGVGLFSVFCSKKSKNITLVEIDRNMTNAAQKTFERNGIANAKAIASKAEDFLQNKQFAQPDCIVLDPPRIGLDKSVISNISKLSTKKIIYISCDPATQARDCKIFDELGYRITKTAIFDCYPNTYHIESGVVLVR